MSVLLHFLTTYSSLTAFSLPAGTPSLIVRPEGPAVFVGPLLDREAGRGCLSCLLFWHHLRLPWTNAPTPASTAQRTAAAELAIAAFHRYPAMDWEWMIALILPNGPKLRLIPIVKRPDCPECGGHPAKPLSMADRIGALGNPVTGILLGTTLVPDAHGLCLAHGAAILPLPHNPQRPALPPIGASGSGGTPAEARDRMIYEAAERHSIVYVGNESFVRRPTAAGGEGAFVWAQSLRRHDPQLIPAGKVYLAFSRADFRRLEGELSWG